MKKDMEKQTKIDKAIYDTELRLNAVGLEIQLAIKKRDTLEEQLQALLLIKENKDLQ